MSFLFVDRIFTIDAERATGEFVGAAIGTNLPVWVVIEAVGQLAGWIAAARTDFASRPVAALVGEVRLSGTRVTGPVALEAQLDRVDGRAVLYSGCARSGGAEVAVLSRCVGPLLPMDVFDDPAAVHARLEVLRHNPAPATPRTAAEFPHPTLQDVVIERDVGRAHLQVPLTAAFFGDHFPRRPVYPATLLAAALNELACDVAASALGGTAEPARITDFKVRAFSPPGQHLELTATVQSAADPGVRITINAQAEGKRIATGTIEYRRSETRQ